MRIGSNHSHLSIERVGQEGPAVVWRIEAVTSGVGWRFAALHDCVKADGSDDILRQLDDFVANRAQRFEMRLMERGWLRVKRDSKGNLLVRYRVGQASTGAALEGEVCLKGKAAGAFCNELGNVLRPG